MAKSTIGTKEYADRLSIMSPDLELIGEYRGQSEWITLKCKQCGHEFKRKPSNRAEFKCPLCNPRNKIAVGKQKTNEEFIIELRNFNPNIVALEQYINAKTKIKFKCLLDGYEWSTTPHTLLKTKNGCPKCAKNAPKTTDEFKNELKTIDNTIIVLGEYKRTSDKIKVKCSLCGREWETTPNALLSGKGCIICKTKGEYPLRLHKIFTGMVQRCYNPKNPAYKHYGLRGIGICDEWKNNRIKFFEWAISNGYTSCLSIDRINNDDMYSPDNCRWVDQKEQTRNTSKTIRVEYDGELMPLAKICDMFNLNINRCRNDFYKNKPIQQIIDNPKNKNKTE